MISEPILMLCDNNDVIALEKQLRSHQKSKHILRRFHLIMEIIALRDILVERVTSTDNISDLLTKLFDPED